MGNNDSSTSIRSPRRWVVFIGATVLLAVLVLVLTQMIRADRAERRGALDATKVLAYGEWGESADGLRARLIALRPDLETGYPPRFLLCLEVMNVSGHGKRVFFGGPESEVQPYIQVDYCSGISFVGEWAPDAWLAPSESAYRSFTTDEKPNKLLSEGQGLSAKLVATSIRGAQKASIISGALRLAEHPSRGSK